MLGFTELLMAGVRTLPLVAFPALLLVGVAFFNHNKLKRKFTGSAELRGVVQEFGTRDRPYRHTYVICTIPGAGTVEIPCVAERHRGMRVGEEIPVYQLSDDSFTVTSFEEDQWGGRIKRQILFILLLCVFLSFLFPFAGSWLLRGSRG